MAYQRTRIQSALIEKAQAGVFYPVSYDADTKLPEVDDANPVTPKTVLANETTATHREPERNRRSPDLRERDDWQFELRLEFAQEVLLERFEEVLETDPIKLPRDDANDLRQVTLDLTETEAEHPPHAGAGGTRVVYRFNARVSPR